MATNVLELVREGAVVRVIRVGAGPVLLGRHLDNNVVLADPDVSGHHAVIVVTEEGLCVRDLRSLNGTFLNGDRVVESAVLRDGDELRLGSACVVRVREVGAAGPSLLVLTDLVAGTVHALVGERVHIGSAPGSDVQLPSGPRRAATLTLHDDGELWLATEAEDRGLTLGEPFAVGDGLFRVDRASVRTDTTMPERAPASFPYTLEAALDAPGGPAATLRNPRDGAAHTVTAETRATLLYVLARRRHDDLAAGVREERAGWLDDEDVLIAVWGRAGLTQAASGWSVLLHRLRREVEDAGFDASFLEKRRGAVRLRLTSVTCG